jgi:stress-induced morphogen
VVTRQERIQDKLAKGLEATHLVVENESHMHSVPKGSETHFKVLIVSTAFEGLGAVDRHRRVHGMLADELRSGLHALTLRALTPSQWEADGSASFQSPECLGGSKSEAKR